MAGSQVRAKAVANGIIVNVDDTLGRCVYYGFSLRESAGATAIIFIRQGSVTGVILDAIQLAALESRSDYYGPQGIDCAGDLYCEINSGAVAGSIRFG